MNFYHDRVEVVFLLEVPDVLAVRVVAVLRLVELLVPVFLTLLFLEVVLLVAD